MHALIQSISDSLQHSNFTLLFLDALLKSFVVLGFAGGLCLIWWRGSAAARHLIWVLALAGLPLLPVMSSLMPSWQKPLWSVSTSVNAGNQVSLALDFAPVKDPGTPAQPSRVDVATPGAGAIRSAGAGQVSARLNTNWLVITFVGWCGGVLLIWTSIITGQFHVRKLARQTRPVQDADWMRLLLEARGALRLRRAVVLLRSAGEVMPLTWGWRRPVVLLPAEADQWTMERRRIVLLHELAHVKRWDCLTQFAAKMICALYWFNPLVWVAARRMRVERERACDDVVLNGGYKASEYASHLVEIARTFRRMPQAAPIAMARPSGLQHRITAIVDTTRARRLPRLLAAGLCLTLLGVIVAIAGQKPGADAVLAPEATPGTPWFDARLRACFVAKAGQALDLAGQEKKDRLAPEIRPYFDAGVKGDWHTVTNLYGEMRKRAYQYENTTPDETLQTIVWQPVNETFGAWQQFEYWEQKYLLAYGDDIINSIPPGSIYFGGTDPGRWAITALSESHAEAKPFFTLTQNALADSLYLEYVRVMYGSRIHVPTTNDAEKCFGEYVADAGRRLAEDRLRPGEQVRTNETGTIQVSGQVAVMEINARIARIIFDSNPDREFYIEESFPLDWMYPHLSPNGLIMKINRLPLAELSEETVRQDHAYWTECVKPMIGDWLDYDTSAAEIAAFVEKVHLKHDFSGFKGDPRFIENLSSHLTFSKERSSIGGLYAWRMEHAGNETEKARMTREADFAFRQAVALSPYSPEAVFRYVNLLLGQNRNADALLIAETASRLPRLSGFGGELTDRAQVRDLAKRVRELQPAR